MSFGPSILQTCKHKSDLWTGQLKPSLEGIIVCKLKPAIMSLSSKPELVFGADLSFWTNCEKRPKSR